MGMVVIAAAAVSASAERKKMHHSFQARDKRNLHGRSVV